MGKSNEKLNTIVKDIGGDAGALMFLKDPVLAEPEPEFPDFIIRIDRLVKPIYPDWMKELIHPELELVGPAEYNLQTGVEQWPYCDHKNKPVRCWEVYDYLKNTSTLKLCLNLQDGFAIQRKGIKIFRELFKKDTKMFLLGSVVQFHHDNYLLVPFLREEGGEVVIHWRWFNDRWSPNDLVLRFKK